MSDVTDADHAAGERGLLGSVLLPVGLFSITIVAGTVGYLLYLPSLPAYANSPTSQLLTEGFFRSLGFLVLAMGSITTSDPLPLVLLTAGRLSGFLFFFYAALAGFGFIFREQLRPLRIEAWAWLGRLPGLDDRGHVLICGIGDDGYELATEALEEGRNVVAVDIEHDDRTADLESKGAIVLEGDATHEPLLTRRARLRHAASVFLTTGNDATNAASVETIAERATAAERDDVLELTARIEDRRLRRTLHEAVGSDSGVYLRTYGIPDATARELLATAAVDDIDNLDDRVHIWLVGWTPLSRALLEQLLHLMHYPEGVERRISVIAADPDTVREDVATMAPGIDPDWWEKEETSALVRSLFPEIEVHRLPQSDMALLSDRLELYDTLESGDRLTIFADDTDTQSLRALISTWEAKLDDLTKRYDLDTDLYYRGFHTEWRPAVTAVDAEAYEEFGDGCSIQAVKGERRDRIARRLALVYHLLYAESLVSELPDPNEVPVDLDGDFDAVVSWLESLPPDLVETYSTAVWRSLPEYQRESNRHAAAHAAVKHRMASLLETRTDRDRAAIVRALAITEHQRWCSEKILNGWEPLPAAQRDRWEEDAGETILRRQRYHPDIRPVEALRAETDGEWEKDVSQVMAILDHPDFVGYGGDGR